MTTGDEDAAMCCRSRRRSAIIAAARHVPAQRFSAPTALLHYQWAAVSLPISRARVLCPSAAYFGFSGWAPRLAASATRAGPVCL